MHSGTPRQRRTEEAVHGDAGNGAGESAGLRLSHGGRRALNRKEFHLVASVAEERRHIRGCMRRISSWV